MACAHDWKPIIDGSKPGRYRCTKPDCHALGWLRKRRGSSIVVPHICRGNRGRCQRVATIVWLAPDEDRIVCAEHVGGWKLG
jgi:hypothetical protein